MILKKKTISKDKIRNILLIQLGDIGDVVLTFPAIRALKQNFPHAKIVVAVREKARELIEDCRWADGVISVIKEKRTIPEELFYHFRFFMVVRRYHFNLAADMKMGDRGAILALCSGASQRVGFFAHDGMLWRNRVFNRLVLDEGYPGRHMAQYYLSLMASYGITTSDIWPEHIIPEKRMTQARKLLADEGVPSDRPMIALQPFSLWKYKEWGIEKYIKLIDWLVDTCHVSAIITGSHEERRQAEKITDTCKGHVYNLAGKTSIGVLPALFRKCKMFIGVDSAGMHIAAAIGLPTVSIFGPSSTDDWAPRGKQHRFVCKNFSCVPCKNKGCNDSGISRCLNELTLEEVQKALEDHMKLFP
ncbi:MAG: glycosyltransferase family 9 protein [Syntrophales bacterium]|jgi:heptosyltransferase-3|nr:glycosyltransferase family 9 protein [Syntrophales bacterium]MDY0044773.1 glycosyltransferase family 9 protein [Syntrophales bacterium]